MDLIGIPTLNRAKELQRLLEELTLQYKMYGHDIPIKIFDHSRNESTSWVVEAFPHLDIEVYGQSKREKLIQEIHKNCNIPEDEANIIFSNGYGGNRNFMLAMRPLDRVISIDDDVVPIAYRSQEKPHHDERWNRPTKRMVVEALCRLAGVNPTRSIDVGYLLTQNNVVRERYDFLTEILQPLGKDTSEFERGVGIIIPLPGENAQKLTGFGDAPKGQVVFSYPLGSYRTDSSARYLNNDKIMSSFDLKKTVLSRNMTQGYLCYAADNTIVSEIPFIPTQLRYEDNMHDLMMHHFGKGCFCMIGRDVMHIGTPKDNIEELIFDEITATVIPTIGRLFFKQAGTIPTLGTMLALTCVKGRVLKDVLDSAIKFLLETNQIYNLEEVGKLNLYKCAQRELLLAGITFTNWPRIIEYRKNVARSYK